MTLQHLLKLSANSNLTTEETSERFDLLRSTRKGVLKEQLVPRIRAPYQMDSLETTKVANGRILLSWKDMNKAQVGAGQTFELVLPAGQALPSPGTSLNLQFNDQLGARPELGQVSGSVRPPKAYGNDQDRALQAYKETAEYGMDAPVPVGTVIAGQSSLNEDGSHTVSFTVRERDISRLDWHVKLNYQADLNAIIDMSPEIVDNLRLEAEQFVGRNQALIGGGNLREALSNYAVASFGLPVQLSANQGQPYEPGNYPEIEKELRYGLEADLSMFGRHHGDERLTNRAMDMVDDGQPREGMTEEAQEEIQKRLGAITSDKFLQNNKLEVLAKEIYLNHLSGDTLLTKIMPLTIKVATLGLPGFSDNEQEDNTALYEKLQGHNEESEKSGLDNTLDAQEERAQELLQTEKDRMSVLVGPATANGINKLKQFSVPRGAAATKVAATNMANTKTYAPMMSEQNVKQKLLDMFPFKKDSPQAAETTLKINSLARRISANWYNPHSPDRVLRRIIQKGLDKNEQAIVNKNGALPVLKALAEFTSYTTFNQKARSPINNRLVAHALFGIRPGKGPREAVADFSLRVLETHRMPMEGALRRKAPSQIICAELAEETVQDAAIQDLSQEAGERFNKNIKNLAIFVGAAMTLPEETSLAAQDVCKRAGIRLKESYTVTREENSTPRNFLLEKAYGSDIPRPASNISEAEKKVQENFRPYLEVTPPAIPEVVVTLDTRTLQRRKDSVEGFGELGAQDESLQKASVTESLLPLLHAQDKNIPYKIVYSNVEENNLTTEDKTILENTLNSAISQSRKELNDGERSESLKADYKQINIEHVCRMGTLLQENLKEASMQTSIAKRIPEVITMLDLKIESAMAQIQEKYDQAIADRILDLVDPTPGKGFRKDIQEALDEILDNDIATITQIITEDKMASAFISSRETSKGAPELRLHESGEISSNRLWLEATLGGKSLDMELLQRITKEFIDSPPKDGAQAVRKMAEAIKDNLLTDTIAEKGTPVILKAPSNGVVAESLVTSFQSFHTVTGALRNFSETTHTGVEKQIRYEPSTEKTEKLQGPNFI